jgi:hypothetical protein
MQAPVSLRPGWRGAPYAGSDLIRRLATDPDHKTRAAPKLNVVTINEALGFLDGLGIVEASQWLVSDEMSVCADPVHPVIHHEPL